MTTTKKAKDGAPEAHHFHTTLLTAGKTATGIEIPPKVIEQLAAGKKPAVEVTINGYTYRSTVAVMGGRYMVGVSADVREAAKVKGGDQVDIQLALDTKPRVVAVPPVLAAALKKDAKANARFESLSVSGKKRLTFPIELAKTDETRDRNLAKAMAELKK